MWALGIPNVRYACKLTKETVIVLLGLTIVSDFSQITHPRMICASYVGSHCFGRNSHHVFHHACRFVVESLALGKIAEAVRMSAELARNAQ